MDLALADIDDLFVLGRNIYQTACGGEYKAKELFENLDAFLKRVGDMPTFHILNGILYEIYFDSNGKLRNIYKSDYCEYPLSVCLQKEYEKSQEFIAQKLLNSLDEVFYLPGGEPLSVDVVLDYNCAIDLSVVNIYVDGIPCMYNFNEDTLYDNSKKGIFLWKFTMKEFSIFIAEKFVVPLSRININYSRELDEDNLISCSHYFRLIKKI